MEGLYLWRSETFAFAYTLQHLNIVQAKYKQQRPEEIQTRNPCPTSPLKLHSLNGLPRKLAIIQIRIESALLQKLLMRTLLDN